MITKGRKKAQTRDFLKIRRIKWGTTIYSRLHIAKTQEKLAEHFTDTHTQSAAPIAKANRRVDMPNGKGKT